MDKIALIHHPLQYWIDNVQKDDWPLGAEKIHEACIDKPTGSIYKYLCWLYNEDIDIDPKNWKWNWIETK